MCELIQHESVFIEIAKLAIPFLLGLFASFFIDKVRSILTNRKNRKFVKFYLKNSILKNLPPLSGICNAVPNIAEFAILPSLKQPSENLQSQLE